MRLTNDGNIFFPNENGQWVSEKQRRVAEVIRDYDPNLQLQWIPNDQRGPNDYAFRVVDFTPGRPAYAICFSHEADERLLARIFDADNQRNGGTLNVLDKLNSAIEALRLKEAMEKNSASNELAYSILHSQKIHYKHDGFDFGKLGGR